jgi:peptidoglycan/xylan/chitin deacetylase (PgdA/CDA1 family)
VISASKRQGTLLISFDCEGKFGLADRISPAWERRLSNPCNTKAYVAILNSLERRNICATFAFVGAFTLHPDELPRWRSCFPEEEVNGRPWLEAFFVDERRGSFDGWLNPEPLRLVRAAGLHEIASHGFSHLPLSESVSTERVFDRELNAASRLASTRGYVIRTLVYPGNQIGHIERLREHGVEGYRAILAPALRGTLRRAVNVLREFNLMEVAQPHAQGTPLVAIPSGHILNFRHGTGRSAVPKLFTQARWRRLLRHAAETGGVVHLWSHPHNFLSDPSLVETFECILLEARRLINEGRLVNRTLGDYGRWVRGNR